MRARQAEREAGERALHGLHLAAQLDARSGDVVTVLRDACTNADGRLDGGLLSGDDLHAGRYEISFHVGDYFRARGVVLPDPTFLDVVPVRFAVADPAGHYHVPLLVSPWAYSTYRGS